MVLVSVESNDKAFMSIATMNTPKLFLNSLNTLSYKPGTLVPNATKAIALTVSLRKMKQPK